MTDPIRHPLVALEGEAREAALAARGLGTDLIPLDASPAEWRAAMADETPKPLDVVPPSPGPASGAVVNQLTARVGPIVAVLLGVILSLPAAGVTLPPLVVTLATAAVAVLAALGIASPGVRKAP